MKVNHTSIFMGESSRSERDENSIKNGKQQKKSGGTLFAGDLSVKQDSILLKRQQARKAAMKVMMDAHENEAKIDDNLKERKNKIKELQASSAAANQEINEYRKLMEQAKAEYGVTDDSEEQQNLELLLKAKRANKVGSDISLTEEEREHLANMGPQTEYQKKVLELDASADIFRDEINENHKQIMEETEASKAIRQERLKSHAMVDAVNAKDEMILAAAKEEIGMLIDEAKDKIDEEQKKREEEAKKRAEEEKEKEEQMEKSKEEREKTADDMQDIQAMDRMQTELSAEVKNIIKSENLLDEDLLGIVVDTKK